MLSSVKDPLWGGTMSGLSAADDETAVQGYQAVLAAHANAPDTFETTRTQLMYGARLRRSGQRVKAREQLRTAHEALEEMDLTAWVLHAADELAATGAKPRACRPQATEPLTSQETRVALHAAKGMSNKDRGPFPQPEDRRASSEQCLPEARFPFPRGIGRIIPYARGRLTGAASRASGCWIPAGGSRLGEGSAIDRAPRQRWRTRTRSH